VKAAFSCSRTGQPKIGRDGIKLILVVIDGFGPAIPLLLRHPYIAVLEHNHRGRVGSGGDIALFTLNPNGGRAGNHLHILQLVVVGGRRAESDGADVERVGRAGIDGDGLNVGLHEIT